MNIRQYFELTRLAKVGGAVLIMLFIAWFLVMALSKYKLDSEEQQRILSNMFRMEVETCVIRKDMASWMSSKPTPPEFKPECEAQILDENPFRYQSSEWERFKARIVYLFN